MIGILDSGSGGLSVLRALRQELPSSDVVYFGDIKNAPYGHKSQRELSALTVSAIKRLQQQKVNRMISACNSVSASLAVSLFETLPLAHDSFIEMVGPTVASFKGVEGRIALCATEATVNSGMYENAFQMIGKDIKSISIPDLAGAIEFGTAQEHIKELVQKSLEPHLGTFDILILACTHYPLVADVFVEVVGANVTVCDPAFAVAERAKHLFWPQEVGNGTTRFLLSQASEHFETKVQEMFPGLDYTIEVVE